METHNHNTLKLKKLPKLPLLGHKSPSISIYHKRQALWNITQNLKTNKRQQRHFSLTTEMSPSLFASIVVFRILRFPNINRRVIPPILEKHSHQLKTRMVVALLQKQTH